MTLENDRTLIDDERHPGHAGRDNIPNALPPGTRMGEFEIVRAIGAGGFGIVYLSLDHSLGRHVALKEYMPVALAARVAPVSVTVRSARDAATFAAGLRSFVNEAQLLAQFDHPSLVKVYRFWEANGTAYMVMPYYEGQTLASYLRQTPTPPDEAWLRRLLVQLLDALQQLHAAHCFHRDIAPDNILLLPDGTPLLLDFGAARRVIGDITRTLTVILKPGYAPVEQYGESRDLKQGPWTDLYALACVVYYAILGITPPAAIQRLLDDPCQPLARMAAGEYSRPFLRAIDRALAVRPKDRPQSVAELQALLSQTTTPRSGLRVMPLVRAAAVAMFCMALVPGDRSLTTPSTVAVTHTPSAPWTGPEVSVQASGTSAPELPQSQPAPPQPIQTALESAAPRPVPRPIQTAMESVMPAPMPVPEPAKAARQPVPPAPEPEPVASTPPILPVKEAPTTVPKESKQEVPVASREVARRCEDIINRFSLGEPLSAEDREFFVKEACKP